MKKESEREKLSVIFRRIFTTRQAWMLFFCHFGIVGGFIGFISSWAVPYAMNIYGMSRMDASQLIMLSFTGALIGAPVIGWISSRLEEIKRPYIFFYLINLCCWSTFFSLMGVHRW